MIATTEQDRIIRLPHSTIQQIAAGEVITRPVNVVKELVENSIDAGAHNIRVTIEQGGLKAIEVVDNGHGIPRYNAALLCHSHATSKIRTANDLNQLGTFGFRGEALSSISLVADIEVKSFNMEADKIGWQGLYSEGKLRDNTIQDKYIQLPGTQIKASNLFSRTKRGNFLASGYVDEKKNITDLITKLAIHHRNRITFILNERGASELVCSIAPVEMAPCIGNFYGSDMEANLMEVSVVKNENFKVDLQMAFTYKKSNSILHQSSMILFVNDRLVDCDELKREVSALILEFFGGKQYASLTYISLVVPPTDIDVNTHPAKATVTLHYQQEIIRLILTELRLKFSSNLASKVITTGSLQQRTIGELIKHSSASQSQNTDPSTLPGVNEQRLKQLAPACLSQGSTSASHYKRPYDQIHNDSNQSTLTQLIVPPSRNRRDLRLLSLTNLRDKIVAERTRDPERIRTIRGSVFVGIFDHNRALIQYETKLFAINLKSYIKELIYQFYLFDFGNFPPIEILPPGNKIYFMIDTYLRHIRNHESEQLDRLTFKTPEAIIDELMVHADMFEDYLSIKITRQEVLTIPNIVPEHVPNLVFLGQFLVRLANDVTYSNERDCFHQIGRVLADFYSSPPANMRDMRVHKKYHDFVEARLFDGIKRYLIPPDWLMTQENIFQITDTKDLYKVFERC